MSRRKQPQITYDSNVADHIVDQEFADMMDKNFTHYAFKVLEDRALPDARDGLKPSQRRTLYAMHHKLKLRANGKTVKCAKITGTVSGDYHPHGDMVIYPTLVRMTQPWSLRYPLIYGQGNFGDVDGEPPAAQRYTEAKLSREGEFMCQDVDDSVVPFQATYNDESIEPTVLPGLMPNLLVNGGSGIAVGYASNLAPHNLREVVEVIKAYIENPQLTIDEVLKLMPGPDFPTPCILLGQEGVRNYYETGRGTVRLEGIYEIDQDKNGNQVIRITEFPYGGNPKKFVKQIQELIQHKKIDGISDLKNLTKVVNRRAAINVMVWVSKGSNPQVVLNQLLKHTCLRESFSVNTTVLIDGLRVAENVPILTLVKTFVDHRKSVLLGKYTAELEKRRDRLHIVKGLLGITDKLDAVIKLIRAAESKDDAKAQLITQGFVESDAQASAIIAITLGDLTRLEAGKLNTENDQLTKRIEWLEKTIASDKALLKLIIKEQEELAALVGDDRITQIGTNAEDIDTEDLIKKEQIVISLSRDGYIKRIPVSEYNLQRRGGKGVSNLSKRNDETDIMFVASTHDTVLFFTSKGLVYKKRGYQIPEGSKTGKGIHLANLLALDSGERVTNTIPLQTLDSDGYILMTTRKGLIKKSEIREYNTKFKTRGLQAIKLNENDEVAFVETTQGTQDVFLVTTRGKALRYSEDQIRVVARVSRGVKAMKLKEGDSIAQMFTIDPISNPDILVVTELGYGKRTNASSYREFAGRNAQGVSTISQTKTDRNGLIVGAAAVTKDDTLIVSTSKGKIIQIPIRDIRESSRQTMGVKIIDIELPDSVRSIAKVEGGMLSQEDE